MSIEQEKQKYILWFRETGIKDIELVGGKNASLGEMFRNLRKEGHSGAGRIFDHGRSFSLFYHPKQARRGNKKYFERA